MLTIVVTLNNRVSKIVLGQYLGSVLTEDPSGLRVEALPESLTAGLVYQVSSSRLQQGENEHQAVAIHDGRGDASWMEPAVASQVRQLWCLLSSS